MDLFSAIETRRSVRRFRKEPVPEELLRRCIEGARLAPSWANTQVWRFVVIKDQKVKEDVSEAFGTTNPSYQALRDAPCLVCCVAKRNLAGMKKGTPSTDKGDWFMFDCGIAMEHLVLTAWSLGLGTVHLGAFDAKKVEQVLSVPEDYSVVSMTPLGYPDEQPDARPRKPIDEILFLDGFGKAYQ